MNNAVNATLGTTPFEALFGYHPRFVEYVKPKTARVEGVRERETVVKSTETSRGALDRHYKEIAYARQ
jgi:hypothetical protein